MDCLPLILALSLAEGDQLCVYRDSLKHPTVCRGHLVTPRDHLTLGQCVAAQRCTQLFHQDLQVAIATVARLWPEWETYPEAAQEVLVQLAYMLGEPHLKSFHRLRTAVTGHDWRRAAQELQESRLTRRLPKRTCHLIGQLRAIPPP